MDFRERYKRIGFGREDVEFNRTLRSQRREEARHELRTEHFNKKRRIHLDDSIGCEEPEKKTANDAKLINSEEEAKKKAAADLEVAVQKRLRQLVKWREERNRRRLQEKKRAKPVFKVGVVHHRMYSPPLTKNPLPLPVPRLCKNKETQLEQPSKRVTRATEKRLAIKSIIYQQKLQNSKSKKIKKPVEEISIIPKNHQFKAPAGITAIPMFGRHASKDTNENMEFNLSSNNILSNNNNYGKRHLYNTEIKKVLSSTDQPSILPNSTRQCSYNKSYNTDSCVKSNNNSVNDSMNDTSVESVSLKVSFDQEILEDKQNISTDCKVNSSIKKNVRLSTRQNNSPKIKASNIKASEYPMDNQEPMKNQNNIDYSLSNKSKRSSRKLSNKANGSLKLVKDVSFPAENIQPISDSSKMNVSFSKQKMLEKNNKISNNENANFGNMDKENSFHLINQKILDTDLKSINNTGIVDSIMVEPNKSLSARSTRAVFNKNKNVDSKEETNYFSENEGIVDKRCIVNSKWTNLMDSSLLDQSKTKSPKGRKLSKTAHVIRAQDESLIKFSPRRSLRRQTEKVSKSISQPTVVEMKKSPKSAANNQINFSWSELGSTPPSVSDYSIKEKTSNNNEDIRQNFSLNLSLNKDSIDINKPPAYFSPYIVTSRGKKSIRKEIQRHRLNQSMSSEIPTKDTVMQNLNIFEEEEQRTAQYYKYILDQEISRLNELCDTWNAVKENDSTPEEMRDLIQAAVGQTKLLINKKFERFRSLVQDCETGKGEMLVTCKDLQGFWDMMYMEIKDCNNRFNKLKELQARNWIDDESKEVKDAQQIKNKKPAAAKRIINKKKITSTRPSSLRAHIMAARKKQIAGTNDDMTKVEEINLLNDKGSRHSSAKSSEKIARRTSTPKLALQKLTQLQKSTTSPLIVMKLSQMCKTPEVQLNVSTTYINCDRTPAKSILKSFKDESTSLIGKSSNKVLFKEQLMEFHDYENNKRSHDSENIINCKEPIERKLNFESDSFNVSNIEDNEESVNLTNVSNGVRQNNVKNSHNKPKIPKIIISEASIPSSVDTTVDDLSNKHLNISKFGLKNESPIISLSPLTLIDTKVENSHQKSSKTKKQISFNEDVSASYSRTLRSRKFSVPLTPKLQLKSSMKKVHEDLSKEVDDNSLEEYTNQNLSSQLDNQLKELYLNPDGIICQRNVKKNENFLNTPKLKRCNSETLGINSDSLVSPMIEGDNENKKLSTTPRIRRQSKKKSSVSTKLNNTSVEEMTKVKLNKRNMETLNKINIIEKINRFGSPKKNQENEILTPVNNSKHTRLQENVEPSLHNTNDNKSTKKSSSKKNTSKVFTEKLTEQQTDLNNTISEPLTPNRRKSLRIAQVNTRQEDYE